MLRFVEMSQKIFAKCLQSLSLGLCLASTLSPMNAANASQPGLLKSEFIFETAPFPECHASTIVESESGLIAAWFGGTHERHPDVGIWLSRLVDGKWTAPMEFANGIQSPATETPDAARPALPLSSARYPCWNP